MGGGVAVTDAVLLPSCIGFSSILASLLRSGGAIGVVFGVIGTRSGGGSGNSSCRTYSGLFVLDSLSSTASIILPISGPFEFVGSVSLGSVR